MSALLVYRNLADTAAEVSGPENLNFPISFLLKRQLAETWRAAVADSPEIFVDLGEIKALRIIALLATNATISAGYHEDLIAFGSSNGDGWFPLLIGTAANDLGVPSLPNNIIHVLDDTWSEIPQVRYLRILPQWTPRDGAPYYEAGRLWIADALVLPDEVDGNWEFSVRTRGSTADSFGGQTYADKRKMQRVLQLSATNVSTEIAYGFADDALSAADVPSLQDMMLHAGNGSGSEVMVLIRNYGAPASASIWMRRLGIYGHLTDDSLRIRHEEGPLHSVNLTFLEES